MGFTPYVHLYVLCPVRRSTISLSPFSFVSDTTRAAILTTKPADVPALFITSLILFTLFFFWSRHLETRTSYPPIIKPSLFTRHSGRISSTCLCAFFSCLSVYGFVYSTTAFYQNYMGLNAFGNALRMMTCNVTGIFAAVSVTSRSRSRSERLDAKLAAETFSFHLGLTERSYAHQFREV